MRRESTVRTASFARVRMSLFACALALASLSAARAQSSGATLSGRVTDPRGAAVAGATVKLYARSPTQLRLSATTDAQGAYRFEQLAPGAYLVEAEAEGFAPSAAREVAVGRGAQTTLDVQLEVAGVSAQVVVTAADAPQTVDEVSKAVTVVSRRELEERDEPTVAEALRTVPGLRVQQLGGGLARGAELSASLAPARALDLFASYTYTNSVQRRPQIENILRSLAIPTHQFTFVATGRFGRRISSAFSLVATSDYLAPIFDNSTFRSRAFRFTGQRRTDLTTSYTLPLSESRSLRFFGRVENLFDQQYYENGFRTPGINGRAGAALNF